MFACLGQADPVPLYTVNKPMSNNAYESGRLNLPFVGHTTFAKSPVVEDWNRIDADFAVLGVPYDMGCQ